MIDFVDNKGTPTQKHMESYPRDRGLKELEGELDTLRDNGLLFINAGLEGDVVRDFPIELRTSVADYLAQFHSPHYMELCAGEGNITKDLISQLQSKGVDLQTSAFDLYPPNSTTLVDKVDIESPLPVALHSVDVSVMFYGLRYLRDPLCAINQMLARAKVGGFVICNGVDSMKFRHSNGSTSDLFSDHVGFDTGSMDIYADPTNSDWVVIRKKQKEAFLQGELIEEDSFRLQDTNAWNQNAASRGLFKFVYK